MIIALISLSYCLGAYLDYRLVKYSRSNMPKIYLIIWPVVILVNLSEVHLRLKESKFKPYYTLNVEPYLTGQYAYKWDCYYHILNEKQQIKNGITDSSQLGLEEAQAAIQFHKDEEIRKKEETYHMTIPA